MRPAGLAAVEAARPTAAGRRPIRRPRRRPVPEDFAARARGRTRRPRGSSPRLTGSARYAFLYRLHQVNDPARRARRIADYIERLSAGRTLD